MTKKKKIAAAILATGVAGGIVAVLLFPEVRRILFGKEIVLKDASIRENPSGVMEWIMDCPPDQSFIEDPTGNVTIPGFGTIPAARGRCVSESYFSGLIV